MVNSPHVQEHEKNKIALVDINELGKVVRYVRQRSPFNFFFRKKPSKSIVVLKSLVPFFVVFPVFHKDAFGG